MTHRVVLLAFPGFQSLDVAGPMAAFEAAGRYTVQVVATTPGPVRSSSGVSWLADRVPAADRVGTFIVSGGEGVDAALQDAAVMRLLQRMSRHARIRIASVCSGSLLLAGAGLLDGKPATTHWSRTRQFQQRFPQVQLDADRIFTRAHNVWTSAGITAGIDLALAMIAEDFGQELAQAVARELVVYYRRPGGQSQFSALLSLQTKEHRFDGLLDDVRGQLMERHSVEDLASRAHMSPRHFARAFRDETGVTPAKAVERLRVEAARSALDAGAASVQKVARDCGFGDPDRMRRSFIRILGVPPSALRRSRAAAPADARS
ncbi:GlxA family transcriptional regulator [Ideonella sp. BN130291]|uniref:GlxA family transcriptional regulator n=1 Tax=Ideonella sp. BN130291 TaxID=3112940 RepID=UPI002E277241|nr:helix-turn-helix domain-containing protein [Ideonella sp. BN130291]